MLGRLADYQFLLDNVRYHSRRGGVLLMHDRMRADAMAAALDGIATDPKVSVVTLKSAVAAKYACDSQQLYAGWHVPSALAGR